MSFKIDHNTRFHTLKVSTPSLKKKLAQKHLSLDNYNEKFSPQVDYFVVLVMDSNKDGDIALFHQAPYNVFTASPKDEFYDVFDNMVGKELSWDELPDIVRGEFIDMYGDIASLEEMSRLVIA